MNLLRRLYLRFRDRHDPAARTTGYSRKFDHAGHDEAKAVEAVKRAEQHAVARRKAAAKRIPKPAQADVYVMPKRGAR